MRKTMTREFYIPENAKLEKKIDGVVEIYSYDLQGLNRVTLCAIGFIGKAIRPSFNYSFKTIERRNAYIADFVENVLSAKKAKLERSAKIKADGREFVESLRVGDIVYRSWGWEQTNVDFYQVVKIGKRSAEIRAIEATVEETSFMAGNTSAIKDAFVADSKTIRILNGNKYSLWNGRSVHCSWYA